MFNHSPRRVLREALPAILLLPLVLGACAPSSAPTPSNDIVADSSATPTSEINPENWPQPEWPFAADAEMERRVDALLASMTIAEKVGQIVQGDISSVTPEDLRTYRLGSILAGGNSDPGGLYNATPQAWLDLADAFWEVSMDTAEGRKAIPVIFGIDAVHGQSNIVGATLFPHNIGLGATRNSELIRQIGRVTAIETRTTGMEWTFAPTVAVPRDDRWGRSYEGYSEHPEVVTAFAPAMVEGLQGKPGEADFLDDHHVMTSVKHYAGDGGTRDGRDQGDTQSSEADLRDIHAAGYITAIAAGAQAVMASYNSFHGTKMHGHKALLTDVLKQRMNCGGFDVGDWNGHAQIEGCTPTDCAATFNAGLDMAMAPDSWKGLYESTLAQVQAGTIPMERLDDAVRRILTVKFRMGLFDKPKPSARALGGKFHLLGNAEHRAVARQAVRESLVLLKNQAGLLPLDPTKTVLVAGDGAHDLSKQTGGWTLTWQGTGTQRADFPNAESIWEGLKTQVEAAGGKAELATDGSYDSKPDVAIVVFGENPYAEFQGDIPNLLFRPGDDRDLELIRKLKADGIPVVAVFISGRPLWLNREINAADAFVAAWLPGSEGGGIADVLLRTAGGEVQYDFSGKLSYSWPKSAVQTPLNVGETGYDPLFAYGYGLTYSDKGDLAALSETSGIDGAVAAANIYFSHGVASHGFSLHLVGSDGSATAVTTPEATSTDASIGVVPVDHQRQEGARRITWQSDASVELRAEAPMDLGRETNGDVLLVITLRADALPADAQTTLLARGAGTLGELPITPVLADQPSDKWLRVGVPLKCLRVAGADTARLEVPFAIRGTEGLQLTLADVRAATDFDQRLDCPTQ